jgi:hypothetical protein
MGSIKEPVEPVTRRTLDFFLYYDDMRGLPPTRVVQVLLRKTTLGSVPPCWLAQMHVCSTSTRRFVLRSESRTYLFNA